MIGGRLFAQLFGGDLHHFRIRRDRCLAQVSQHHIAVAFGDLLPGTEHDIVESLLEVELRNGSDRSAETAFLDDLAHSADKERIFIHQVIVAQHLSVGRERSARHREQRNDRLDLGGFRRDEVILHRFLEHFGELENLVDIHIQSVLGSAQSVPERDHVRLTGAAGDGSQRQVYLADTGLDRGNIGMRAGARSFVGMENDARVLSQELAGHLDGLMHFLRTGSSRRVLESDTVERNARVQDVPQCLFIEGNIVRAGAARRQFHHGDGHLVFQSGVVDALAAPDQVIDIVQSVKIADDAHAVFFEHFGMKIYHVFGLGFECDDIDAA